MRSSIRQKQIILVPSAGKALSENSETAARPARIPLLRILVDQRFSSLELLRATDPAKHPTRFAVACLFPHIMTVLKYLQGFSEFL